MTWEGRYSGKMILYPHCDLQLLLGVDIPRHFHGVNYRDSTLRELHSSMLLFLPDSEARSRVAERFSDLGDLHVLKHLSSIDDTLQIPETSRYGGMHIFKPGSCFMTPKPYLKWEKKYLKKLEKEQPTQAPTVLSRQVNIKSSGRFGYDYGNVDIRHIPLLRSSKFLVVDGAGGSVVNMSSDDVHLVPSSSQIPLASNYGQVFLLVLHCLPMFNKIQLLKVQQEEEAAEEEAVPVTFLLPSGATLTLPQLTMIAASSEIADELYSCSGSAERMQQLAHAFEQDVSAYVTNGRAILQGLELINSEIKLRKKKVSNARVSLSFSEINRHTSNMKRNLKRAGVSDNNLSTLTPFDYLACKEHLHRCHQHWIDDDCERWNLVDM